MAKVIEVTAYVCPLCETLYEDESEAIDCCGVDDKIAYQCSKCRRLWDEKEDGEKCCKEEDSNGEV